MKNVFALILLITTAAVAAARLGETEAQMVARFGKPIMRSKHTVFAQGKSWDLGPTFYFKQEDWRIHCDLVDGRCVRIAYGKPGDWTEEQFTLVMGYNSQGMKWTETTKPGTQKFARSWRRSDGATANWMRAGGMKMVVPAYERAKQVAEAKAKADASRKPKI